jgi:hypothetical protein
MALQMPKNSLILQFTPSKPFQQVDIKQAHWYIGTGIKGWFHIRLDYRYDLLKENVNYSADKV